MKQLGWHTRWAEAMLQMCGGAVVGLSVVILIALGRMPDLLITNVRVFDGDQRRSYVGDLAISGERFVFVRPSGHVWPVRARTRIDGRGLDVAPGFIDSHSHADSAIATGRPVLAENFTRQGVTTMIVGNCGRLSVVGPRHVARHIHLHGSELNIAVLAGYNSLRQAVMGDSVAGASASETAQIVRLAADAMRAGAVGISTGFPYFPGRFASRRELLSALTAVGAAGGVHASHVRDEGGRVLESLQEVLDLSREANLPLIVSHLKISGPANCGKAERLFELMSSTAKGTFRVFADQYPYLASSSSFDLYLPDWFQRLSARERRHEMAGSGRARLKASLREAVRQEGFESLDFMQVASTARVAWRGKTIAAIDSERLGGRSSLDSQLDVVLDLIAQGGSTQLVFKNLCTEVLDQAPLRLDVMIGSDSTLRLDRNSVPHPRGWGTFPRVLASAAARGDRHLADAVNRMSALPASVYGIDSRGRLESGYFADFLIFDRARVIDRATFDSPFVPPEGIMGVWVNGVRIMPLTRRERRYLPGRFVPRSNHSASPRSEP